MKLMRRMLHTIICTETRPLETVTAIEAILWGLLLMLPLESYGSSSYAVLGQIIPETITGIIVMSIGVIQLVIVHLNKKSNRRNISLVMVFLWTFIDVTIWLSNVSSTATVTYLVIALCALWSVTALSVDEKCG